MIEQSLSIVMLVHNRPRLVRQALESLRYNTLGSYTLTVVDDGSDRLTKRLVEQELMKMSGKVRLVRNAKPAGPGVARNQGIRASQQEFVRGRLLYSADSDCYFKPGWDRILLECWDAPQRAQEAFWALGGYNHPYQLRGRLIKLPDAKKGYSIAECETLGLFSWLMAWETWDRFGEFLPVTKPNSSDDWEYAQRLKRAGGRVGVVEPQVLINCGVTGSDGRLCPGAELLWEQNLPEGVVIE